MKVIVSLAILLGLASWALLGLTFTNLLSGNLEERVCQTDCVRSYYFAAAGVSLVTAVLALITMFRAGFKAGPFLLLVFCGAPFAIIAGIFVIGIFGTMPH